MFKHLNGFAGCMQAHLGITTQPKLTGSILVLIKFGA